MREPVIEGDASVRMSVDYDGADDFVAEYDATFATGRAFFETSRSFEVGARVRVTLAFPGLRAPIGIDGVVVEVRTDEPGIVIDLGADARRDLAALVEGLRARDPRLIRRTLQILVVEDNPHLAGLLRGGLKAPATSEVELVLHSASDGREALALLGAGGFDLAIVDVYLPFVDGPEVIRRARAELGLTVPFIAVSAGGESARHAALTAGATAFLDKPIRLRDIFETVRRLCDLGRTR